MKLLHTATGILLFQFVSTTTYCGTLSEPDWTDVSRIFNERCINCHSALGASKGLRLDSYQAAVTGSERGAVLLPGDAANSELVRRLRGESVPRMPFLSVPLPQNELDLIIRWIDAGLPAARMTD